MRRLKKAMVAAAGVSALLAAGILSAAPAQASGVTHQGCTAYVYRYGGYSSCVGLIQRSLNGIASVRGGAYGGYQLAVDNSFGYNTYTNVTRFQRYTGISADGIVGNNTWYQLCRYAGSYSMYGNDAWYAAYDAGCIVEVPVGSGGGYYNISRY
jgi:peptidoglycan hydrolase-like protein with peptidoglycan-binding domain